jgi:hypothetical protein
MATSAAAEPDDDGHGSGRGAVGAAELGGGCSDAGVSWVNDNWICLGSGYGTC